jgi:hypothetical protein
MRPTLHHIRMNTVRSAALFVSPLQRSEDPSAGQVQEAIAGAVRRFGTCGCAERVAQEFGDHPEIAVVRMCWARQLVDEAFGRGQRSRASIRLFASSDVAQVGRAA